MHYLHNHLVRVVFQGNFNVEPLKVSLHATVKEVCERLSSSQMKKGELTNILVTNLPNQAGFTQKFPSFIFEGERYVIQIHCSAINITDKGYTHHDDFHSIVSEIFNTFNGIYKPEYSRLALRYANSISYKTGDTFDFASKIENSLLNATILFKDFGLTRTIGIMNIHGNDDINVNFTYGFLNPSEYPNRIAKREFVLDYDCFITPNTIIADIKPILLQLRSRVNDLFEKSILPELRKEMEPQN